MKKILLSATFIMGMVSMCNVFAQMEDGSIAPDWTMTDLNNNSHTLYSYLDAGKTVFIDFSATWCGPCWSYHTSGALENLYTQYGPSGTDEVMVFMIEGDAATNTDCLYNLPGCNSSTYGDWVTGTPYPIIDDASQTSNYQIAYWPTIYMVCPNRQIFENSQISTSQHYAASQNCQVASYANDPSIINYLGSTIACGGNQVALDIILQNMGTSPLTSATIQAKDGATVLATYSWTGNLNTYDIAQVTVGNVSFAATTNVTFDISSADDNAANNTYNQTISVASVATSTTFDVEILTDNWPEEITWDVIRVGTQTVVASGGPYTGQTNTTVTDQFTANIWDCYEFHVYDSYGDGITSGGYVKVSTNATTLFNIAGSSYSDEGIQSFKVNQTSGINEVAQENLFKAFPNPTSGVLYVSYDLQETGNVNISVFNVLGEQLSNMYMGRQVGSNNTTLDLTNFAEGIYYIHFTTEDNTVIRKISITK